MGEQDFFDDVNNGMYLSDGSDMEDNEGESKKRKSKSSSTKAKVNDGTIGSLESIILQDGSKKQNEVSICNYILKS